MTTTPAPAPETASPAHPGPPGPPAPPVTGRPAGAVEPPGAITYHQVTHPLGDGDLLCYDPEAVRLALDAGSRGGAVRRAALGAGAAPDEGVVRALELRLRRRYLGRARRARGRALWWWLLGPALALVWINFAGAIGALFGWLPPLAALIGSLGYVAGGPVLATVVGLAPLLWAWRRALGHGREARQWGRLARYLGTRRFRQAPLERRTDPALTRFLEAGGATLNQVRSLFPSLPDRGADAAAELARLARSLYLLAVRHGLPGPAGAFHELYAGLGGAEQRLARLERTDTGVLAERRAAREARRARQHARARLAAFVPSARAATSPLAPAGGLLAGAAALALALLFSGAYFVEPGQAVIIDPPAARAARLAGALGLQGFDAAAGAAEVERTAGYHWTWPAPFAGRHAVALGTQRVRLRAIIRYPGQEPDVGLLVELRFQIVDPERWAQFDRGDGVERLSAELSSELQLFVVGSCRRARQALEQQDPSLASNPAQLLLRTAGFIEANVQDLARAFVARLGSADPVREAGIEVEREAAAGVVRGVSTPLAIPVCGE